MRFDDSLSTVLAADSARGFGAQATWRQLVDLIGRRRVPCDANTIERLRVLRSSVPDSVRAASARALAFAVPPTGLVALFAEDELGIAAPVLRTANLPSADWAALLPALTPPQRSLLRHRRDLDAEVKRALDSFGSVDFVLGDQSSQPLSPDNPADTELPTSPLTDAGVAASDHARFEIADLVARIDAFREKPSVPVAPQGPPQRFTFATDPAGIIRIADGVARGALLGLSLAHELYGAMISGRPVSDPIDARAPFKAVPITIAGDSDAAGSWLLAGLPAFHRASGAFMGHRGTARRQATGRPNAAEPVRQLVHELRTPANAIGGFSELIETELLGPIAAPYRERAGVIRAQAAMLTDAIDDLDTAARIESGALDLRPGPVALGPLLDEVVARAQPQAEVRGMRLELPDVGTPMLFADDRAAAQLLSRLMAALIALAETGEAIGIHVEPVGQAFFDVTFTRPRALTVGTLGNEAPEPTGQPGVPLLGTGFALRLASNLAHALGGNLIIAADCLTLRLPAAEEERVEAAH